MQLAGDERVRETKEAPRHRFVLCAAGGRSVATVSVQKSPNKRIERTPLAPS